MFSLIGYILAGPFSILIVQGWSSGAALEALGVSIVILVPCLVGIVADRHWHVPTFKWCLYALSALAWAFMGFAYWALRLT